MKKTLFSVSAAASLLIAGCDFVDRHVVPSSSANWQVGTTSYSAGSVSRSGNTISAYATNSSSLQFIFASLPATGGTYTIVNEGAAASLTGTQVAIQSITKGSDVYLSTGSGGKTANITVTNGKLKIIFPVIEVSHTIGGPALDSTTMQGSLQE